MKRLALLGFAVLLSGCAGSRGLQYGILNGMTQREYLVSLYATTDQREIARVCQVKNENPSLGAYGCQWNNEVKLSDDTIVLRTTVVRLTDRLPSAAAFEVEAHELCHVAASLQHIDDPCHLVNGGVIQSRR